VIEPPGRSGTSAGRLLPHAIKPIDFQKRSSWTGQRSTHDEREINQKFWWRLNIVRIWTRRVIHAKKEVSPKSRVAPETTDNTEIFIETAVQPGTFVNTDGSPALRNLKNADVDFQITGGDKEVLEAWLPRVFRFIENAKTWLAGTFHGVKAKYLPRYLAEYTYRFNRRHDENGLFHRVIRACSLAVPITLRSLCA